MIFVFDSVENFVGKGENAGYQHFLLFPQWFHKLSFPEVLKVGIMWWRVNQYAYKLLFAYFFIKQQKFRIIIQKLKNFKSSKEMYMAAAQMTILSLMLRKDCEKRRKCW